MLTTARLPLWWGECARPGATLTYGDHVESMRWKRLKAFNNAFFIAMGRRSDALLTVARSTVYPLLWDGRSKHFTLDSRAFDQILTREVPVKRAGLFLRDNDWRL